MKMPLHLREFSSSLFSEFLTENRSEVESSLKRLNQALQADYVFIAVLDDKSDIAAAHVVLKNNEPYESFAYELAGTPCADVRTNSSCLISNEVFAAYPNDPMLVELGVQSYFGIPIRCSDKTIGLFVALSREQEGAFEQSRYIVEIYISQLEARLESEWRRRRLESSELLLNEVCSMSEVGAWEFDVATASLYWSDEVYRIYGVPDNIELTVDFAMSFFDKNDIAHLQNLFRTALENGQDYIADFKFTDNYGQEKWIRTNGKAEKGSDGKPKRLFGAIEDISEEKKALDLEMSTARYLRGVLDSLNDAVVTISDSGEIVSVNERALKMFGYTKGELTGQNVKVLMPEPYASSHDGYMRHYQDTGHAQIIGVGRQLPALRKNGEVFQMELALSEYKYGDNLYYIGIVRDITERILANDTIYNLAFTDSITGLPNRALLEKDVTDLINRTAITENFLYFAYINVDGLSNLNLAYGKQTINQLLKVLSQRISAVLGNRFLIFKLKVDGFFIVSNVSQPAEGIGLLGKERVEAALLDPSLYELNLKDELVSLSASISSMISKMTSIKLDSVIDSLEFGMKKAKRHKPFGHFFLGPVAIEEYSRQKAIKLAIHKAILNDEFSIVLQPQYRGPCTITSSEALVRWTSSSLGFVSPAEFIPIAEETDDIVLIGDWVIEKVCQLLAGLAKKSVETRVAINISAKQIVQTDFEQKLKECTQKYGVSPSSLMLELTETTLVSDIDLVKRKMKTLTQAGYSFSIDDFGTGYSSLSYIKELPISELKIDKYFVDGIGKAEGVAATNIVNVVIDMAKALKLEVVAEGVETQDQLNYLIGRGCDVIQGYLLSKPIPEAQWIELVIKSAANHE
ncbi:MAG: EAL domain-containing protein [Pseudomonadaceae bacterium]